MVAPAVSIEEAGALPLVLLFDHGSCPNRHAVTRMLNRVAKRAGLRHIQPHRLRQPLGTQAVNRGMRLEAVAALLEHQTRQMTARYARIANRTVAAEYQVVTAKVDSTLMPKVQPCATSASSIAGCSPTDGAHGRLSSTATSKRSVKAAGCSPPLSSSNTPPLKPITPPDTANSDDNPSIRACSTASTRKGSHDRPRPVQGSASGH